MARRPRDYHAEHARRNALARERGYRSYAQERKAVGLFRSEPEIRRRFQRSIQAVPADLEGVYDSRSLVYAWWWRSHMDPTDSKSRERDSWRAWWFVEVTGQVESFDVWEERYAPHH